MTTILEIENLEPGNVERTTGKTEIAIDSMGIEMMAKIQPVTFKGWKVISDGRYFLFFKNPILADDGTILNPRDAFQLDYMPNSFTIAKFFKLYPQNYPYGYMSVKNANQFTGKGNVEPFEVGKEYPSVNMIRIAGRAKGTSIATDMYEYVVRQRGGLWSDWSQTVGAKALWAKLSQDPRFTVLVYDPFNKKHREIKKTIAQPEDKRDKSVKRQQVHHEDVPVYFTYSSSKGVKLVSKTEEDKHKEKVSSKDSFLAFRNVRLFLCLKGQIPSDFQVQ